MFGPALMGIFLLALGVFVCREALELTLGQASRPGPGFVSFGLGSILIVLAALYLLQVYRRRENSPAAPKGKPLTAVLAVAIVCLFAAVVGWLGYILSTFLLFTAWLSFIDRKKWAVILPLACLAAVAAYCFNVLFSVQLPPGLLKGIVK
jgi:divalent metal cation (Fe/Co/Zn/Cd) transporter